MEETTLYKKFKQLRSTGNCPVDLSQFPSIHRFILTNSERGI